MATDLLIVSPGFPGDESDDTCIPPLQEYLMALRKSRPELRVSVIALHYPYTTRTYEWHGITVYPCNARNSRLRWPIARRRAWKVFDGLAKEGPIACVHGLWLGAAAAMADEMARKCKGRSVVTLMGQDARDNIRWLKYVNNEASIVCLTPRHADVLLDASGHPPNTVIPWGSPERMELAVGTERSTDLLFVGSRIPVKRPEMFAEVFRAVAALRSVRAVTIGGDGHKAAPPPSALIERTEVEHGTSRLIRCGALPRTDVLQEMMRAKVLVHTSAYESQGYVFDEALAAGMSIVSFPVGSAVQGDRWRVVDTVEEMTAAVIDLLDHPPSNEPTTLHPMHHTLKAYLSLYGLA